MVKNGLKKFKMKVIFSQKICFLSEKQNTVVIFSGGKGGGRGGARKN